MLRHQNHLPTAFKTLSASRLKLLASLLILLAVLPLSAHAQDIRSYSEVSQFTERRTVTEHRTITERASWYGPGLNGRKTASGEIFSSRKMTAAAKGIPLGSRAVVTNLKNGRSVEVKINDCVPTETAPEPRPIKAGRSTPEADSKRHYASKGQGGGGSPGSSQMPFLNG